MALSLKKVFSVSNVKKHQSEHKLDEPNVSHDIDYHLQLSAEKEQRTIRILLMGPSDSGKSELVKQWKKMHSKYTDEEIKRMSAQIQNEVIGYMKLLCVQSMALQLYDSDEQKTQVQEENRVYLQEVVNLPSPYIFNHEFAQKLTTLWADPGIQETWRLRAKYHIAGNMEYFLGRLEQICAANYKPDFEDLYRIQPKSVSTGSQTESLTVNVDQFGEYHFEFMDVGGQRSERRRWLKVVADQMDALLYVVSISQYDEVCYEDSSTNCLVDALNLFEDIIGILNNRRFFKDKSVFIFLNNFDVFQQKIKKTPITAAFDDFPVDAMNPHDENQAADYIASKFAQCAERKNIKTALPLHFHRTSALDLDNLERVFGDIRVDLVKSALRKHAESK